MTHKQLLGGMSPATFLKRHWQKRPLLVRGAFKNFVDPVTPDELAGLAMEEGGHARLVLEKGGERPWQLLKGPFADERLRTLPPAHWSLLVSRVNDYVEDAAALLDRFRFLPHWRLDDLMVSFAPPGGTVGAHIDSYDVFLIQGQGRRRWQIDTRPDPAVRPGLDLRILKRFKPEQEWVLEPGDMLYLPPGVAHYGVALEPCLTYSVGFRAPSKRQLLQDFMTLPEGIKLPAVDDLYADPDLEPARHPGEVSADAVARLRALVQEMIDRPDVLSRWLGAYVTRGEPDAVLPAPGRRLAPATLAKRLAGDASVWRADDRRLAWSAPARGALFLFIEGRDVMLPVSLAPLVRLLTGARRQPGTALLKALPRQAADRQRGLELLADLLRDRVLYLK